MQANDGDGWGQKLAKGFREDQWKLIATKDRKPLHLFNLDEDVAEEHDLIDSEMQKARIATMLRGLNKLSTATVAHQSHELLKSP